MSSDGVGDASSSGEIHAIGFGCNYFHQVGRASPRTPQHELPIPEEDAEDVTPTPYIRRNYDVVPTCEVECVSLPLFPAGVAGGGGGSCSSPSVSSTAGGGSGGRSGGSGRVKSSSFTRGIRAGGTTAMGKVSNMFSSAAGAPTVRRVSGPFKSPFLGGGGGGSGSPSACGGGGGQQQGGQGQQDVAETSDETTTEEDEDAAAALATSAAATTPVGGPPDAQLCCGTDIVRQVVCGATHTAVLSKSGDVYTMGTLHGNVTPGPTLCPIKLPLKCTSLAHGRRHVIALLEGGAVVLSWGAGHFGQLGHGADVTYSSGPKVVERLLPQQIGGRVTTIAAGGLHSAALIDVGGGKTRAFAWGFNRRGQCGTEGGKCNTVPLPSPVVVPKRSAAPSSPSARSGGGGGGGGGGGEASKDEEAQQLIGFGAAAFTADMAANPGGHVRPPQPQAPSEGGGAVCFTQLALGRLHSVALSRDGHVYCWGASSGGRCGLGEHHTHRSASGGASGGSTSSPQRVEALRDVRVVRIAAGDRHNLALTDGGHVYSWGMGSEGQLGHGHTMHLHTPRIIADLDFGAHQHARGPNRGGAGGGAAGGVVRGPDGDVRRFGVTNVYASGCYSAALTGTGDIFTWGYGDAGNLGHVPLPRQNSENLPKVEPGPMSKTGAGLRIRDARSFDSRLNVLLPRRVSCTRRCGLRVVDAALGPVHMILLCEKRPLGECGDAAEDDAVPKTLYEIEIGRRSKGLARLRAMRSNRSVRGGRNSSGGVSMDSTSASAMTDAVVAARQNVTEEGLEVERISSLTSSKAPGEMVEDGGANGGDHVDGNCEASFGGRATAAIAVPPSAPATLTKGTEDEMEKVPAAPDGVDDDQQTGGTADEAAQTAGQSRQGKTLKSKFSMFRIGGNKKKEKEKESSKGRMKGGKS